MKKTALLLLVLLGLVLCAGASAQTFSFRDIYATVDVPDTFELMMPDTLNLHQKWVSSHGATVDELAAQWKDEGILLVGATKDDSVRLVISAVQDEDAKKYFDLDQQENKVRTAYRAKHLKDGYADDGYHFSSAEWKKASQYGRFLSLKYRRTVGESSYRGYARKTVRNGYTIMVDYQVYGRTLKNKDNTALEAVMKTFSFTQVLTRPAEASEVTITAVPPAETSTGKFTVTGTCDPGIRVQGVVMRMSSNDKVLVETNADKKGKFSLDVKLSSQGVWLMTLTASSGSDVIKELVFDPTTYSETLLPVTLDAEPSGSVTSDELILAGTTIKGVQVQCLAGSSFDKQVRTNNNGRFRFKIPTKQEGEYDIVLVLQKKGYNTRRFTFKVTREITEAARLASLKKSAVKPAYSTLTKKLKGYTGRVMGYNLYVIDGNQVGDEFIMTMAMTSTKSGYKNLVYVMMKEDPGFAVGTRHKMYGTCTGEYTVGNGEKDLTYPCFDLLFWDD